MSITKLNIEIPDKVFYKAKNFESFRLKCKKYLSSVDLNWDKFTVVTHDSFIGYITEYAVMEYLKTQNPKATIQSWESSFDMKEVIRIVNENDTKEEAKALVKEYFYDKWDLRIEGNTIQVLSDVKTALTKLTPSNSWNFMYPVVQAEKKGKDIMVLVYYVVKDINNLKSLKEIVLVGYTTPSIVRKCKVIKAGEKTRFGTVSQIDNYVTELSRDYMDINEYLKDLIWKK